jgi:GTP-binding protein
MKIKNVAIIAHVDHGKTTLVDAMLKQTHTFRDNQKESGQTLIMDSNDLEKEKGITILSKNTSVFYKDTKINIIDTPGHADFGGEVERVLNMGSGAILLVDAAEGPLPQTKFVLKKALEAKLKIILVINKIDKKDARPLEVLHDTETLFLDLADHESNLHFITLYAVGRDGKVFLTLPEKYTSETQGDLSPLFETIIKEIPNAAVNDDKPFQMMVSTLDYDNYVGKLCIGKVTRGTLSTGDNVALVDDGKILGTSRVQKLYTSEGLKRVEVKTVSSGDIIAIAGIPQMTIGQTVTDPNHPESLPKITVEEPTIKVTIGPNTSPFSGKEGKFCSSAQIKERLTKEKETNLGLKIEQDSESSNFVVSGRGELHLAVLIETMRREGFEMEVSKPQVIYREIDGKLCEPFEEVTIDVNSEHVGIITEELGKRKGEMRDMLRINDKMIRFVFLVSSQNLLGLRNSLLTKTRGTVSLSTYFLGYFPKGPSIETSRNGALIAGNAGITLAFGLSNAQNRGILFVGPGTAVYEGMVVGVSSRDKEMEINVCKAKKQTNVRSETADIAVILTPPTILSLEQMLDFLGEDELLEVTPKNLRMRKKILDTTKRYVVNRKKSSGVV